MHELFPYILQASTKSNEKRLMLFEKKIYVKYMVPRETIRKRRHTNPRAILNEPDIMSLYYKC